MIIKGDNDKVFIGPFIGEFGHELFSWQAYMREFAKNFKTVVVSSRKEYKYLYEDFCDEFVEHDAGTFNSATFTVLENFEANNKSCKKLHSKYSINKKFTIVSPNLCPEPVVMDKLSKMKPDFIMFGDKNYDLEYDIVIHPRNFGNFDGALSEDKKSRDWNLVKWNKLIRRFTRRGMRVATIGLSSTTFYIEETEDLRDISLKELADVLHNSKCIMGPSSGPMHFATLCGCPQLVWSHPCNRDRYLTDWNPFDVYVNFHDEDSWKPSVDTVFGLHETFLKEQENHVIS